MRVEGYGVISAKEIFRYGGEDDTERGEGECKVFFFEKHLFYFVYQIIEGLGQDLRHLNTTSCKVKVKSFEI